VADLLRPLRGRLRDEAQRLGVPLDVVERDYAIGYVLAALYARAPSFRVFKATPVSSAAESKTVGSRI